MTFAVIDNADGDEKIVGTIWASAESDARMMASDLMSAPQYEHVVIRRAEEREIPMKPFN